MSRLDPPQTSSETPPPRADPLAGSVLDGKYRLDRVLAKGGSGRVYVAEQLNLGRPVAVKVLRPDLDGEDADRFEERFFREASMSAQLNHPHVVTVHDYGRTSDGTCFLAMELLQGRSLKVRMKEGPLPPDEALPVFEQIVRGLRHAHKAGLVHRDMKPGNVQLVPGEDGLAFAKILDFGLVREEDAGSEITREGYFVGTPHYAAPEQVMGRDLDARADLYSVGVMLYRALCGRLPYWSKDGMAIAIAHCQDPYPPMAERSPDVPVPAELEAIVRRCMAKDPDDRYADASALLLDLRAARRFLYPAAVVHEEPSLSLSLAGAQLRGQAAATGEAAQDDDPPTSPDSPVVSAGRGGVLAAGAAAALLLFVGAGAVAWSFVGPGAPREVPEESPDEVQFAEVEPEIDPVAALAQEEAAPAMAEREITLVVTSMPPGAEVSFDGSPLGTTPLAEPVVVTESGALATRTYTVSKPGYQPQDVEVDVSGEIAKADVTLQRVRRAPAPSAAPAPAPSPSPSPAPAASSAGGRAAGASVTVDGVEFSPAQARATLRFINNASKHDLLRAQMSPAQANKTLGGRPFASVEAYGATYGIGPKTIQAAKRGAGF